jgi:hypothetical protein
MFPFLDDSGPHIEGHPLPIYQWLQLASSVLGLLVLVVAVWMWRRGDPLRGFDSESTQDSALIGGLLGPLARRMIFESLGSGESCSSGTPDWS